MRSPPEMAAEPEGVADLATVRKRLADHQRRDGGSMHPRYLFRGQSADHGSITPTFARKLSDETEIGQAYTVCRYAKRICQGLRGYSIDYLDGIAILQHYGWPTPLIDFTGSLEIAVFFALLDAKPGSEAVVYVLDTEALPDQALVLDHGFLTHPLDDGAFGCRWLRQDGFAVTTKEWTDATEARAFDLLAAPFLAAIEAHKFTVADGTALTYTTSCPPSRIPSQPACRASFGSSARRCSRAGLHRN